MEQFWLVYLLSISVNVSKTLNDCGTLLVVPGMVAYIVTNIYLFTHTIELDASDAQEAIYQGYRDKTILVRKHAVRTASVGFLLWVLAALCPTPSNLLKSYALIEGSKVINAKNAEATAVEVGKRFDRFLDIVERSVTAEKKVEKK